MMSTLISFGTIAQNHPVTSAVSVQSKDAILKSDIAAIRNAYTSINTLSLKPEPFKFESPGCVEDGQITYFRNSDDILKVKYSGGIGDGSWTTEFYFNAGKLIFCYDKLIGGPAAGKAITTEYRLYVKADRPIRCMENKKIIQPDSKATESINTAYKLLKAYKSKNIASALCN
jgi:hypothetical protein